MESPRFDREVSVSSVNMTERSDEISAPVTFPSHRSHELRSVFGSSTVISSYLQPTYNEHKLGHIIFDSPFHEFTIISSYLLSMLYVLHSQFSLSRILVVFFFPKNIMDHIINLNQNTSTGDQVIATIGHWAIPKPDKSFRAKNTHFSISFD